MRSGLHFALKKDMEQNKAPYSDSVLEQVIHQTIIAMIVSISMSSMCQIQELFEEVDTNKSGEIDEDELFVMMNKLSEKHSTVDDSPRSITTKVKEAMQKFSSNGVTLSFSEFMQLLGTPSTPCKTCN